MGDNLLNRRLWRSMSSEKLSDVRSELRIRSGVFEEVNTPFIGLNQFQNPTLLFRRQSAGEKPS
ncbi:MAG: hypothetical protein IT428_03320 [Planctomycetaceae bacterium]|nr:hypothetical protein [Planctomycetaceae bacterium]